VTRWEYHTAHIVLREFDVTLNRLGNEGWELVQFLDGSVVEESGNFQETWFAVFKRPYDVAQRAVRKAEEAMKKAGPVPVLPSTARGRRKS